MVVMSMNSSLIEHYSQCCPLVSVTCKINKSATHYNNMASGLLSLSGAMTELVHTILAPFMLTFIL